MMLPDTCAPYVTMLLEIGQGRHGRAKGCTCRGIRHTDNCTPC